MAVKTCSAYAVTSLYAATSLYAVTSRADWPVAPTQRWSYQHKHHEFGLAPLFKRLFLGQDMCRSLVLTPLLACAKPLQGPDYLESNIIRSQDPICFRYIPLLARNGINVSSSGDSNYLIGFEREIKFPSFCKSR